jgi:hypothetical protein
MKKWDNMEIIGLKALSNDRKLGLLYSKSNGFSCIVEFVMQSCSAYTIVFLSSAMTKYEYTENDYTSSKIQGPSYRPPYVIPYVLHGESWYMLHTRSYSCTNLAL